MSLKNPTKIKPFKVPCVVFKVDGSPHYVEAGETVEILIDSSEPFTVFLPYLDLFDGQLYPAVDASSWTNDPAQEQWWGVRMTRIVGEGRSPIKEMPYCIYSKELNNFAVGNSPPTMILDP